MSCHFKCKSLRTGADLHGIAAMVHVMKNAGGPDEYIASVTRQAAKEAVAEAIPAVMAAFRNELAALRADDALHIQTDLTVSRPPRGRSKPGDRPRPN